MAAIGLVAANLSLVLVGFGVQAQNQTFSPLSPAQLTAALAAIRAQIAAKDPKAAKGISDAHIRSSQAYQNYIANLAQQTSAEEQAASSEPTEDK